MFEEPVHVDVGKQWARDAALWRAASVALASTHAPFPVSIPFLDRRFQPQLDQPQHCAIRDPASYRLHQLAVRNQVKVLGQVSVHHIGIAPADDGRTVTRLWKSKSVIANSAPEGRRRGLGGGQACDTY